MSFNKLYNNSTSLKNNDALIMLIIINAVAFVLMGLVKVWYLLSNSNIQDFQTEIFNWFIVPSSSSQFATKPWTLFTHMFVYNGFWHLLSTMLWLYCFGFIFQDLQGGKRIIPLFIYGGLIGSIVFLISSNLNNNIFNSSTTSSVFVGAGTAVMTIAIATTTLTPNYRLFPMIRGGIPFYILTAIYLIITFGSVGATNLPYTMAYFMAGFFGFIYIVQLKRGFDFTKWMIDLYDWVNNLFNPEKKNKGSFKLYYNSKEKPYTKTPNLTQQKIDEILDKINQQGYQFLNDEEKEFLKKASKEEL